MGVKKKQQNEARQNEVRVCLCVKDGDGARQSDPAAQHPAIVAGYEPTEPQSSCRSREARSAWTQPHGRFTHIAHDKLQDLS